MHVAMSNPRIMLDHFVADILELCDDRSFYGHCTTIHLKADIESMYKQYLDRIEELSIQEGFIWSIEHNY